MENALLQNLSTEQFSGNSRTKKITYTMGVRKSRTPFGINKYDNLEVSVSTI